MEWVTKILGLVGGGWGSFAAIVGLGVLGFILVRMWNKAKQDKASADTKNNSVVDHGKVVDKNIEASNQIKKDDAANEAAIKAGTDGPASP